MTIDERIEFLMQSIESHDRQIGELTDRIGQIGDKVDKLADKVDNLTDAVAKLVTVTNQDASAIRSLARIAEAHEQRIAGREGKN